MVRARSRWVTRALGCASLALVASLTAACECSETPAGAPPPIEPAIVEAPAPVEAPGVLVPPALRTNLPEAVPAITVTITDDGFVVSNAELVASWPAGEREALASPDAPEGYPVVERRGRWPDRVAAEPGEASAEGAEAPSAEGLVAEGPAHEPVAEARAEAPVAEAPSAEAAPRLSVVSSLVDALRAVAEPEERRSAGHRPSIVALRAASDVPWSRVQAAVLNAGLAGFAEPRFVLQGGRSLVEIRMPLPTLRHMPTATLEERPVIHDATQLGEAIRQTLARQAVAHPETPRFTVSVATGGVMVRRDGLRLAPGCARDATGEEPSVPTTGALDADALRACLGAAAGSAAAPGAAPVVRSYTFTSDGAVTYGEAVRVLELVDEAGPVVLATEL